MFCCACRSRQTVNTAVVANAKRPIDIAKQGLNSVKNSVVKKNLQGVSESMSKKGWKDSQGRSGKVKVVFLGSYRPWSGP